MLDRSAGEAVNEIPAHAVPDILDFDIIVPGRQIGSPHMPMRQDTVNGSPPLPRQGGSNTAWFKAAPVFMLPEFWQNSPS